MKKIYVLREKDDELSEYQIKNRVCLKMRPGDPFRMYLDYDPCISCPYPKECKEYNEENKDD